MPWHSPSTSAIFLASARQCDGKDNQCGNRLSFVVHLAKLIVCFPVEESTTFDCGTRRQVQSSFLRGRILIGLPRCCCQPSVSSSSGACLIETVGGLFGNKKYEIFNIVCNYVIIFFIKWSIQKTGNSKGGWDSNKTITKMMSHILIVCISMGVLSLRLSHCKASFNLSIRSI